MATNGQRPHKTGTSPASKPRRRRLTQSEEDAILGQLIEEAREEAQREGYVSEDAIMAILRKGAKQTTDAG